MYPGSLLLQFGDCLSTKSGPVTFGVLVFAGKGGGLGFSFVFDFRAVDFSRLLPFLCKMGQRGYPARFRLFSLVLSENGG